MINYAKQITPHWERGRPRPLVGEAGIKEICKSLSVIPKTADVDVRAPSDIVRSVKISFFPKLY
jgi:hypothetical protein